MYDVHIVMYEVYEIMFKNSNNSEYSALPDRELVSLYKVRDYSALLELISRYSHIMDTKIKMRNISESDFDDIHQELLISFINAVNSYNDNKAILFSTFVSVCLENSITNSVAKMYTKKRQILSQAICLDDKLLSDILKSDGENPEQIYIDNEDYLTLMDKLNYHLSSFEKNVLFSFLDRKSYDQIAQELFVSTKVVDNAMQRVRRKLKTVFQK